MLIHLEQYVRLVEDDTLEPISMRLSTWLAPSFSPQVCQNEWAEKMLFRGLWHSHSIGNASFMAPMSKIFSSSLVPAVAVENLVGKSARPSSTRTMRREMLSSIQVGLSAQKSVSALPSLGGDQPQIQERTIRDLLQAFATTAVQSSFQAMRRRPSLACCPRNWDEIFAWDHPKQCASSSIGIHRRFGTSNPQILCSRRP
jgi:hypothetical protein